MQLREYLDRHGLTQTAFAARAAMPLTTLHGLLSGRRSPSLALMTKIAVQTNGAVQPNDWATPAHSAAAE